MIAACDTAFDLARQQAKSAEYREKARAEKASKEQKAGESVKKVFEKWKIHMDIDKVRLSHLLQMKQAFRSCPGQITVEILFESSNGTVSSLFIDQTWGVDFSKELETKVNAMPSVKRTNWIGAAAVR